MKKQKQLKHHSIKRIISLVLSVVMLLSITAGFDLSAYASVASGTCGSNLTWTLDSNYTLTISGTGAMKDYNYDDFPWYKYCSQIKSVIIDSGVTSIGNTAFYGCTGLTSIIIPDSVTSIGSFAFYNTAYYNNSSNWENNVLYIGNHLIKANTSLSGEYSIKEGTKCIADYAFYYCTGLTSIIISDSVTSIGDFAFMNCTSLTSIIIPDSVTSIGEDAFYNCTGLTNVTIPDSVTSIGNYAFYYCTGLTSITIPDSVTNIGSRAFCACTGLTSVTIPDSVTSIGSFAFYYCTGLTSITIPDSVTSIDGSAFGNTAYYNNSSNWENDVLYIPTMKPLD